MLHYQRLLAWGLALLLPEAILAQEKPSGIKVDRDRKAVIIDAKIAPRKLADPKFKGEIYPIEVIATWAYPKGQKAHETVVTIEVKPSEVHKALESLGGRAGKPVRGDTTDRPSGTEINIYLEIPSDTGSRKVSIDRLLIDPRTGKTMPKVKWFFTGSVLSQPDPNKDEKVYGADLTGTLIAVFPVTNETVLQSSLSMKEEKYLKLETNKKLLPAEGTAVKLVLELDGK